MAIIGGVIMNMRSVSENDLSSDPLKNSLGMEFVLIPAGEFLMGSEKCADERPVHKVAIEKSFYIGKYPVTQGEWVSIMDDNPSSSISDDLPVEHVSWNDVQEFIRRLNTRENTDKYRLPSEAEWEFACRAGTTSKYSFGNDESDLAEYAWYSGDRMHTVGQKRPNKWGLHDMHGDIWEWCQDRWHANYEGAPVDGSAWEEGSSSLRVDRGGCWSSLARYCRSALRSGNLPGNRYGFTGFRLVMEP